MSTVLQPCHCGYSGALEGVRHREGFLSLSCPECQRTVEAFTLAGLAENWNKPADEQPEAPSR
ncbi:hypothetical protein [Pseudomonas sp. B392_1p]|uniref:hypothetical protein n=1 Tax=Pseudomonas sp. B392_1p TaxID=3457507 RepID=UPI003FD3C9B5